MTLQTLAAFLISWAVPGDTHPRSHQATRDELPRWELHPVEQKRLRELDRRADLWSRSPRPW